jgi:hypothetical protein
VGEITNPDDWVVATRLCSRAIMSGCITTCASLDDAAKDGDKCAGNGCCQTAMPGDLNEVRVGWSRGGRVNSAWNYSSCVCGFIAEKGWCVMILSFYLFLKMMIV